MAGISPLRIVVVGVGRFGALHLRTWIESGAEIVGVVDIYADRLAEIAERHAIENTGPDARVMVPANQPQLGVIDSDESTHTEVALLALEHGAHVLIEKP